LVVGVVTMAASVAFAAVPLQAGTAAYGGLGATPARFYATNAHGAGTAPAGQTYYRVDEAQKGNVVYHHVVVGSPGRVVSYHVDVGSPTKRSASALLARLTGRELPSDAQLVKPYNGYCAVYRSRWLGKVIFGLPRRYYGKLERFGYAILYVNRNARSYSSTRWPHRNEVNLSLAPICRG
jgi:hypothetical protein